MTTVLSAFSGALLHFAWQGLAVFLLLWAALFALRKSSANARYAASCAALALLAAAPLITTYSLYRASSSTNPTAAVVSTLPPSAAPNSIVPHASSRPIRIQSLVLQIQAWVLPVWAFGVLIFSLRMVWGCAQVATLRRRGQPVDDAVLSIVATLSRRLGLMRRTRVLISAWAGGPSLVGWLRPVILLPASAIAGLTPQQLEGVLAHELAHVRRHDYLVNWIQMLVETLLFYHPAVWWVSSRIRHERELCCDDLAVSACDGPLCYARALTTLEKMRAAVPTPALGSTGGALLYRIQRIMGATAEQYGPSRASGIVAMSLAVVSLVLTMNWAQGQSQPQPDYLSQGDILLRTGANELALQKYRAGVEQDPSKKATYQKRCIEVLLRMSKRNEAFQVNAELLREHPDDTDALGLRAVELLDQGNVSAAIALLSEVILRAPDNPVAHLDLGRAYAAQREYEAARREMREAIRLRPDFDRAKQQLAKLDPGAPPPEYSSNALAQLGGTADQPAVRNQFAEALALLQTESEKAPDRLDLTVALGNAAVRAGKYDLAITAFQKALDRVGPDSKTRGDLYLRLGEAYRRKGEMNNAIDALLKAKESMPDNPAILSSLAAALEYSGRHAEALQITAQDEVNRSLRHSLVISFLQTELANAQKRLITAQLQRDPESVRQAQAALVETTQKLTAAEQEQQALGRVLERIDIAGLSEPLKRGLHLPVQIGDILTAAKIGATITAVQTFDPGLDVQVGLTPNGAAQIVITRPRR